MKVLCVLLWQVGRVVEGVVTSTVTYGAFLDVGQGVAGLLHISQITHGLIPDVSKILKQGDRVKVRGCHCGTVQLNN